MFGQTTSSLLLLFCQGLEELIPHSEHTFVSTLGGGWRAQGIWPRAGARGWVD